MKGIQDQHVIATAKHFGMNEQEKNRDSIDEVADERVKFEMYYPPFAGAIQAGVGAIMCSYNRVDGTHACQNGNLLNQDLRERLGFNGFVMSDWGALHNVSESFTNGLDQEQGGLNKDVNPIDNFNLTHLESMKN